MIKVALIVMVTSSMNLSKLPDISITDFYDDMKSCNTALDNIKLNLSTEELFDENKIRYLKMELRQSHQEGNIYWTCIKKSTYNR